MLSIQTLLQTAQQQLSSCDSARLDAEVLLAYVLSVDRSYLYAWPEKVLSTDVQQFFEQLIVRRACGEPVAHLTGKKEFYSLLLEVDSSTLIPRPETEMLVDLALQLLTSSTARILDLGTGTGAIALALAHERPAWHIIAVDRELKAVELAGRNAATYGLSQVEIRQSNWFDTVPEKNFDLIVSNPPYIDSEDPHLLQGDVRYEPRSALVAGDGGLADIRQISQQACSHLRAGGYLILEHGFYQGEVVRGILQNNQYLEVQTFADLANHERVTVGRRSPV